MSTFEFIFNVFCSIQIDLKWKFQQSNNLHMTFAGYKKIQSNILYFTIKFKMLNKNNLIEGKIRFCFLSFSFFPQLDNSKPITI
jgi:hypothetical protein